MSSLPCLNPHCKSHGKPHPNCRCYGPNALADGGMVGFCSEAREHSHECEYYAGGGIVPENDLPESSSGELVPEHDLPGQDLVHNEVPASDLPSAEEGNWVEQAKAAAEGFSQGVFPLVAPLVEVGLGISTKEAIAKRQQDYPVTHGIAEGAGLVGGLLSGSGEMGLIAKGAGALSEAAKFGKIGSAAIKAAIESASFTGADEATKAFLGVPGSDPEHPVSAALLHVGAAGLMGGLGGGAFSFGEGLIGKGIDSEAGTMAASKAQEFLFKLGQSHNPMAELGVSAAAAHYPAYKTAESINEKTGIPTWMAYIPTEALYTVVGRKAISKMNPHITSAAVKALSENEAAGVPYAIHYATKAANGLRAANRGIKALFESGSSQIATPTSESAKNFLKEFIEGGQVDKQLQNSIQEQSQLQGFAHGGQVKSEPNNSFSKVFPEQNTLLSAAKGRISNYLNSVRPLSHMPKKAFDDEPQSSEQHRQYNKALDFAVNPLSILDHVNKGNLTPEHMKHFTAMYPEVHRFLSNEMAKGITEAQLKKEKPPYGKRQAMSLFLGADLDSSFSPMAIQTIQNIYSNKKMAQQQQVPVKNKKGTSSLSKTSNSYQTDEQSRERRMQNQKS